MGDVITIIFPVFGVIALGYIMVRRGLFSQSGVDDLTRFIFYLAVPALLFRTSASGVLNKPLEFDILIAYYGMGLFVFFLTYFIVRKSSHEGGVVAATGACFSNLALIGLPLVQTAFPPQALVPLVTILTFNAMILFTLPCVMIESGRNDAANIIGTIKTGLMSVITNPLVIALCAGWAFSQTGATLPVMLDRITDILGKAAAPCALFAVGGGMARYSIRQLGDTCIPVFVASFCKLAIMPVGVWLICTYIIHASELWTMIATMAAAMSSGANVFVLATRYQTHDRVAGNTILITTALSLISLSAFLLLYPIPDGLLMPR